MRRRGGAHRRAYYRFGPPGWAGKAYIISDNTEVIIVLLYCTQNGHFGNCEKVVPCSLYPSACQLAQIANALNE